MEPNENTSEYLERLISEENISIRSFLDTYYREKVDQNADAGALDKHADRYKKSKTRAPERIATLIEFFNEQYRKDGRHTLADRDAAWAMYVELDSRIATQELKDGDLKTALSSLASLFQSHRNISKQYGHRCRRYYEEASTVLNQKLRPFLSKCHERIEAGSEIEPEAFKNELKAVQADLRKLKSTLYEISK